MSAAIGKLLECSIAGIWVIAAILLLRLVLRKAPRRVIFALWLLAAVRLLCPVSIESNFSLVPETEAVQQRVEAVLDPVEAPEIPDSTEVQTENIPGYYVSGISATTFALPKVKSPSRTPIVWLSGFVTFTTYSILSYLHLRRKLTASCLLADNIFICDYIDTPFALGIFRPRIFLPSELEETEIPYILAHEKAHIRRLDPLWKLIGYATLCIHWFNPAVWLAWFFFCRDMEMACDEAVIQALDNSGKAGYSRALLQCSAPGFPAFIPPAFNKNSVKARVKAILSYKRPGAILTVLACILLIAAAVCLLTSPISDRVPDIPDTYLMGQGGCVSIAEPEDIKEVNRLLEDIIPRREEPGDLVINREDFSFQHSWQLDFILGDELEYVILDEDCSVAFFHTDGPQFQAFRVKNTEKLREIFDRNTHHIYKAEATGERWAYISDVEAWLHGIEAENLTDVTTRAVKELDGESYVSTGYLRYDGVEKLLKILHDIPESAVTYAGSVAWSDLDGLQNGVDYSVTLCDGANDIIAVLQGRPKNAKLYLCDRYGASKNATHINPGHDYFAWDIDSAELQEFLTDTMPQFPPVTHILGSGYNWSRKPLTYSHGDDTISVQYPEDWTYEIVEYTNNDTPFGIRVRPGDADTGWIFFSCWPNDNCPEAAAKPDPYSSGSSKQGYEVKYCKPEKISQAWPRIYEWKHCHIRMEEKPDRFVIINDKTDSWYSHHYDCIQALEMFADFW